MEKCINWNRIYLDYSPKLLGICRRYVPDVQTAEDILQDSFITAIQKEHQLKNKDVLYAWLKKIVVNNALLYLRNSHQELFVNTEPQNIPDQSTPMTTTIEDSNLILGYDFTTDELLWSIDQLPPHHRSVFNLYYLENFSHSEIAENLGININTSKSHLLRAKKGIKQHLTKKTEGKNITPLKKAGIRTMVFLGMGNLLWAQAFQSKFKNFTIQPQRNTDFSQLSTNTGNFDNYGKTQFSTFLKRGLAAIAFFAGIILFNNFHQNFSLQNTKTYTANFFADFNEKGNITQKETPEKTTIAQQKVLKEAALTEKIAAKSSSTEPLNTTKKKNFNKTTIADLQPKADLTKKATDSSKTEDQPVVVVKKIVKKVKVYVEK